MKNIILIIILFIAIPFFTRSQTFNYDQLGIEVGAGSGGMRVGNADIHRSFSYRAGAFVTDIKTARIWFTETGLFYESTGANMKGFLPGVYSGYVRDIDLRTSYFTTQIMVGLFKKELITGTGIYMALRVGTYLSLGLNSHANITGIDSNGAIFSKDIADAFKEEKFTEAGVEYVFEPFARNDFGAKYALDFGYKQLSLRITVTAGFIKLHPSYDKKFNTGNVFFSLGYVLC
ncbi:MAG: hypothetical protein LBV41_11245 [Cytophagaceae bacterium]|jgi:hypothetical protein|nr:hypothetical protein [Cytophagaceae bacterium]